MSGRVPAIPTALVDSFLRDKPDNLADYLYNCIHSVYDMPVFDECNDEQLKELAARCDQLAALAVALGALARSKQKKARLA